MTDIPACAREPKGFPKFAVWLFQRRMTPFEAAKPLGISKEHARRICLPFDDDARKLPNGSLRQTIASFTAGEVSKGDWDQPCSLEIAA